MSSGDNHYSETVTTGHSAQRHLSNKSDPNLNQNNSYNNGKGVEPALKQRKEETDI